MLLFFLFLSSIAQAYDFSSVTWELSSDEDEIQVFRGTLPNSNLVAFRGRGLIYAPVEKIVGIILDTKRAPEWASDLEESKVVKWISPPFTYLEYNHVGTPFIMKDRDFVSVVRVRPITEKSTVFVDYLPANSTDYPETRYIRGDLAGSGFKLLSVSNGTQTFLDGWIICDLKGSVPKWIVNWAQSSWPRTTIEALRVQAAKTDVKAYEPIVSVFSTYPKPKLQSEVSKRKSLRQ